MTNIYRRGNQECAMRNYGSVSAIKKDSVSIAPQLACIDIKEERKNMQTKSGEIYAGNSYWFPQMGREYIFFKTPEDEIEIAQRVRFKESGDIEGLVKTIADCYGKDMREFKYPRI